MDTQRRAEILRVFGGVLAACKYTAARANDMPFERRLIEQAILDEWQANKDSQFRERLGVAFVSLDVFVGDDEFQAVTAYEDAIDWIARAPDALEESIRGCASTVEVFADRYQAVQRRINENQELSRARFAALIGLRS